MITSKTKEVDGLNYYLTLEQIHKFYCPKYLPISEWKMQEIGTTVTINNDTITIIPVEQEKYKHP